MVTGLPFSLTHMGRPAHMLDNSQSSIQYRELITRSIQPSLKNDQQEQTKHSQKE